MTETLETREVGTCRPVDSLSADDDRPASILETIIATEIVPRLTRSAAAQDKKYTRAASQTRQRRIERLARLSLKGSLAEPRAYVENLRRVGLSRRQLVGDLFAGAARHLGAMWEQDTCTFVDVTVGLNALHELLHETAPPLSDPGLSQGRQPSILLLPAPGEQHIFGLVVLSDVFRDAGWHVDIEFAVDSVAQATQLVRRSTCDCIGFSVATTRAITTLTQTVSNIRNSMNGATKSILVGGEACARNPALGDQLGADASATTALDALKFANALVTRSEHFAQTRY